MKVYLLFSLLIVLCLTGCQMFSQLESGYSDPELKQKNDEIADLKKAIEADAKEGKIDPEKVVLLTEKLQELQTYAQTKSTGRWYDPFLYILGGLIGYPLARIGRRVPMLGTLLAMGDPNKPAKSAGTP